VELGDGAVDAGGEAEVVGVEDEHMGRESRVRSSGGRRWFLVQYMIAAMRRDGWGENLLSRGNV
jgi:hypothetical protein